MGKRTGARSIFWLLAVLVWGGVGSGNTVQAQEAINMPAATQPSKGVWVVRSQFRFLEAGTDPVSGNGPFHQATVWNNLAYGVSGDLSVNVTLPLEYRDYRRAPTGDTKRDWGVADSTVVAKWRVFQNDFGPIDSARLSLLGGVQMPTGSGPFSTGSFNPEAGAVYTHVQGRHGFNLAAIYKFNTGSGTEFNLGGINGRADALCYDASYLFRLAPARYTAESTGAWYAVAELNGVYETNGDNEPLLAPGVMYEAQTWTVELSVQIPVFADVSRRAKTRYAVVAGFRKLF